MKKKPSLKIAPSEAELKKQYEAFPTEESWDDFANQLSEAMGEKPEKTKIIDMAPNIQKDPYAKMPGQDFIETREKFQKKPPISPGFLRKDADYPTNLHSPDSQVGKAVNKMQKVGKFKRIMSALGKRGAKAVPYVGTGLGLLSAKEAMAKGDKIGAALETASAIDPTPLSDIALAGKDVYEILSEKDNLGEQESPDVEFGDNKFDYRNELEKRKKIMGYK